MTPRLLNYLQILIAILILNRPELGYACASCGSGSASPLILYPNEGTKVYLGITTAGQFKTIDTLSQRGADGGASRRETFALAVGSRFSSDAFVTLSLPVIRNVKDGRTFSSVSDPSLYINYTLLQGSMAYPLMPQIQLVFGHTYPFGRSIRDTEEGFDPIKITSSGNPESELGLDVWFGPSLIKWGAATSALLPQERTFAQNLSFEPGIGLRSVLTFGVAKDSFGKFIVGMTRLQRDRIRINGSPVNDSEVLNHSLFVTTEYWLADLQSLRLTYVAGGLLTEALSNRNASESQSLTLSWMAATPFR